MIDIGVNLTSSKFHGDRSAVVERARKSGIETFVITGTSLDASRQALELANEFDVFTTAGVHPHDAKDWHGASSDALRDLARTPRVVAIGECGLDFDRNYSPPEAQIFAFREQLEIARDTGLPLFLHERCAHEAMLEVLEPMRPALGAIVIHCFTGTHEELLRYLALDLHIGITGWICDERRGTGLYELAAEIPADRLMVETDAPWLLPRTLATKPKDRRNEPAFLPEVVRVLAAARGEDAEVTARATTATARRFFRLDEQPGA